MQKLREYIKQADEEDKAIGHFNVANLEMLKGVYRAAQKLNVPVIIGVSEGEEEFIGREEIVAVVKAIRERDDFPIFLNADHHHTFESVKACVDAGFDSVIIDAVKLPFEENVALTKQCVEYAEKVRKEKGIDVLVEAELGFIGESSKLLDELPEGVGEDTMTDPETAKRFVAETGVDLLAPSIGNVHGMVRSGNPRLHPERVKAIKNAINIPMVLHGGSGSLNEDFTACIEHGIDVVHISTELRVAYKNALKLALQDNPDEIAPYKYLHSTSSAVEKVVEEKLKLFNKLV